MPIKQSAKKTMRQDEKRHARNLVKKQAYKRAMKDVSKALETGETNVKELLIKVQKTLDKAAKAGVIKPNTAARNLSRLTAHVQNKTVKAK